MDSNQKLALKLTIAAASVSLITAGIYFYYSRKQREDENRNKKLHFFTSRENEPKNRTDNLKLSEEQAVQDIREWREGRDKDCRNPFGWLSLAGLHWLDKGDNIIGTCPPATIIFDVAKKDTYPEKFGVITLREDDSLVFTGHPGVGVKIDGQVVSLGDEVPLVHDNDSDVTPTVLSYSALQWFAIKRSDQYGIRLKDSNSPVLTSFHGIECFPVNLALRVEGIFRPYTPPKQLQIPTGIGTIEKQPCPGYVSFTIAGTTHTLDVTGDRNTKFHVTFADTTSGKETYGGGRMLNIPAPAPGSDKVLIDFNKAYNPPCAFTDFATCGLPLQQNRLKVQIRAGEMKYGDH